MKLAVIFYGQMRFVDNKHVVNTYRQLESLYDVDYFGHLWHQQGPASESSQHVSSWSRISGSPFTDNDLSHLLSSYFFKSLTLSDPIDFLEQKKYSDLIARIASVQKRIGREVHPEKNNRDLANALSHLYSFEMSVQNFRYNPNVNEYDFVLLSRTDNYLVRVPDLSKIDRSKRAVYVSGHHNNFPDTIILTTPACVNTLAVFSKIEDMISYEPPIITGSPERFKQLSVLLDSNKTEVVHLTTSDFALEDSVIRNDQVVSMTKADISALHSLFVRDHDNPPCPNHYHERIGQPTWEPKKS